MSNKWRCRHMGTWSIVPYIKHVLIFHWTKIDGPTWLISNFPFNIDPNSSLPIDKMAGCQTIISLNIDGPQIAQLNNMIYIYILHISVCFSFSCSTFHVFHVWFFPQDNSGFITVENLRQILGETLDSEDVSSDTDTGDGKSKDYFDGNTRYIVIMIYDIWWYG